ncbi:MAG TPA: 4-carboxy-4-hydroxy-2-oxoadipate aldolase/oxaloacetate decarboxylase [Pyrinomonadaceae bacterium]|nr:4-carboxy-4-hydroxy-2-oxoadipate aldolase/oxaloacetate decarboxylase [Pyrinomonadaceae bacterium]
MTHRIIRHNARPEVAVVQALGTQGVATVHEAQGRTGLMRPYLRPIYSTARVAGPAVTVSCQPGDNLMIHAAIEVCQAGDVLVVAPTSDSTDGMFGELLATSCRAHGIAGLVIDAGVRDVTEIASLKFPIWAKAISAQGTVKASAGSINVEIVCAGAVVRPGDVVVGDEDGVVIVARERAAEVRQSGAERIAREQRTRVRLSAGELGLDFYDLRAKLKELGVEYVNEEEHDG